MNGRKRWITNSPVADWVSVLCRSGTGHDHAPVDLKTTPGIRIGEPDLKMGHRGQLTADIVFDDVAVPAANLLGSGVTALGSRWLLLRGRIGIGAAGVGVAQAALDLSVDRLRTRHVFGGPLGAMQHWQYRLPPRHRDRVGPHALPEGGLAARRRRSAAEPEASMAKVFATRLARDLARDAIQVHGGSDSPARCPESGESLRLEEMYRDAKILEIFEGANEV